MYTLRGRRGAEETFGADHNRVLWTAISSNIDSLISFFDALILSVVLVPVDVRLGQDLSYSLESSAGSIHT